MRQNLLLIILSSSLFFSCNTSCITKDSFVSNFDAFVENTSQKNLSNTNKSKTKKLFNSYTSECYERFQGEMSNKEKVHFWTQTIKHQTEQNGYSDLDKILSPELQKSLERDLDTFTKESKEELIKVFRDEVAPELNNAIDDIVKGIEEIGETLKDWLNEVEKE
jgi:hypothetical protein